MLLLLFCCCGVPLGMNVVGGITIIIIIIITILIPIIITITININIDRWLTTAWPGPPG